MITILIDTMHVADILIDDSYFELARAIQNEKMTGLASVITLTELIKIRGMKDKEKMYMTDDEHFKPLKNIIKPIDLKTALKLVK